jgi:hypothetical protein
MTVYDGSGLSPDPAYQVADFIHTRYERAESDLNLNDSILLVHNVFDGLVPPGTVVAPHLPIALNSLNRLTAYLYTKDGFANRLPTTLEGFAQEFSNTFVPPLNPDDVIASMRSLMRFKLGIGLDEFTFDSATLSNFNIDGLIIAGDGSGGSVREEIGVSTFINDITDRAWSQFLREYQYGPNPFPVFSNDIPNLENTLAGYAFTAPDNFVSQFNTFVFNFATVSGDNPLTGSLPGFPHEGEVSVNFEDIYNAFFANDQTAFRAFLTSYIRDLMYAPGSDKAFVASNQVGDWLKKVQEAYSKAVSGAAGPLTSSVGESFKKTLILDRIFRLIVEMIGTLQQVAASQSDRLRILTLWQQGYTELQTQIHTFTRNDGSYIENAGDDNMNNAREKLNNYNNTVLENIRARRSIVQDDAKQLQSNLNQSNDSANQQANMGTAIIQTLSTLLGAIYR